jgi:stage II sporulation protein D
MFSEGGLGFIVLHSTTHDGSSRITSRLEPGSVVTTVKNTTDAPLRVVVREVKKRIGAGVRLLVAVKADASGRPRAFTFSGRGHGHGIGLCQWGARGRAMEGQSAHEILAAYYPGTSVVDLSH